MKKLVTILVALTIILCIGSAMAWSSAPTTSNTGTLNSTGITVNFGANGIKSSIDTPKCYTGITSYTMKARDLYLANNSIKKPTVTLEINYWSTSHNQWEAGSKESVLLGATNVKTSSGTYIPSKKTVSSSLSASSSKYYYGIFKKDYTSIAMYGNFWFHN